MHHEPPSDISESGFRRFLCTSPLPTSTAIDRVNSNSASDESNLSRRLGSYHQCYYLDGRLVALGVLDLLPHAVSAVYFIYHADVEQWSLGKLSALREAVLALEAGYEYYYMGYYIHNCGKMRYKAEFKPQLILDPVKNEWRELNERMKTWLDAGQYVSWAGEKMDDEATHVPITVQAASTPAEAASSGASLFELWLPGILSEAELSAEVNLDEVLVMVGNTKKQTGPARVRYHFNYMDSVWQGANAVVVSCGVEAALCHGYTLPERHHCGTRGCGRALRGE